MSNRIKQIKIGTRESKLALAQAHLLIDALKKKIPNLQKKYSLKIIKIKTKGDINKTRILHSGFKGFFTKKIDDLLISRKIDIAVHSAKDIPSKISKKIVLSSFLTREDPRDVFLSNDNYSVKDLPEGKIIGTSSIRRTKQINFLRPGLNVEYLRGNVETRIKKLKKRKYDGIILAIAGLKRLGFDYKKKNILRIKNFIPSGGQGAIAIATRKKDFDTINLVKKVNHKKTEIEVKTERSFLGEIDADCDSPIGANANVNKNKVNFFVSVPSLRNGKIYSLKKRGSVNNPEALGKKVGSFIKKKFGKNFLQKFKTFEQKKFTILLTRPYPQSEELKKDINLKNISFYISPLLTVKKMKVSNDQKKEVTNSDAIIFTSPNAVNHSKDYLKSYTKKVYCVGKDTKNACTKIKLNKVISSDGNVEQLIKFIIRSFKPIKGKLIYLSGKEITKNIDVILKKKGYSIKKIIVYKTEYVKQFTKNTINFIKTKKINFITFFSSRTANNFNLIIKKNELEIYLQNITCICLSQKIKKILKNNLFQKTHVCSTPDRAGFVKTINFLNKELKK